MPYFRISFILAERSTCLEYTFSIDNSPQIFRQISGIFFFKNRLSKIRQSLAPPFNRQFHEQTSSDATSAGGHQPRMATFIKMSPPTPPPENNDDGGAASSASSRSSSPLKYTSRTTHKTALTELNQTSIRTRSRGSSRSSQGSLSPSPKRTRANREEVEEFADQVYGDDRAYLEVQEAK